MKITREEAESIKNNLEFHMEKKSAFVGRESFYESLEKCVAMCNEKITQPIITNERVKENINGIALQNAVGKYDYDDIEECLDNVTQYITQLEELNKGHQEIIELLTQERDTAFNRLDKIEEVYEKYNNVMFTSEQSRALRINKEVKAILKEK